MKTIVALGIAIAVIASIFSGPAQAADDGWIQIARNQDHTLTVDGKQGSSDFGKNDSGEAFVSGVFRNTSGDRIELVRAYVRLADCNTGVGSLVTLSLEGAFVRRNDYVTRGGTVASMVADTLCAIYEIKRNEAKQSKTS